MAGFGLALSTMIQPEIVMSLLRLNDYRLLLVLLGAAVALAAKQLAPSWMGKPLLETEFGGQPAPTNRETWIGAAIFGAGCGLAGVCPDPAIAGIGAGNWPLAWALLGLVGGTYVYGRFFGREDS